MSDRPAISQQYAFAVGEDGGTDGGIEPTEESVETSLETFGADVDHRERDSRRTVAVSTNCSSSANPVRHGTASTPRGSV